MTEKCKPPMVAIARSQGKGAGGGAASSGTGNSQSPHPGLLPGSAGGHWELDHSQAAWGALLSVLLMSQNLTEAMERESCSHLQQSPPLSCIWQGQPGFLQAHF